MWGRGIATLTELFQRQDQDECCFTGVAAAGVAAAAKAAGAEVRSLNLNRLQEEASIYNGYKDLAFTSEKRIINKNQVCQIFKTMTQCLKFVFDE